MAAVMRRFPRARDRWSSNLRGLFGDVPKVICASDAEKRFLLRRLAEQVAPRFEIEAARLRMGRAGWPMLNGLEPRCR
jgi:hypothetical protein